MTGWPLAISYQIPGVFQVFPGDFSDFPGKHAFKFSTMVVENFENYCSQMVGNAFKFIHQEKFENYYVCMAKNAFKLNCPPWLEKMLKFTALIWLEIHSNCYCDWRKF